MTKLNLGSGQAYREGYTNIDCQALAKADITMDLEGEPWPFEDGSVTEIIANHVFEHFYDLLWVMKECHRVMASGAMLRIAVPHQCSDGYWGDPTHVRPVTLAQLELFSRRKCAEFAEKGWPNTPLALYCDVDFEVVEVHTELMPHWQNRGLDATNMAYVIQTYNNVVNEVGFVLRKV